MQKQALPIALTIAGSDSGGGAGIQADLKTFHAFGVYGTSAITAVTAQNTTGVVSIHAIPSHDVRAQIDAVVTDLRPAALKTGMLATAQLVTTVAAAIREHGLDRVVVDPVMVSTSGDRLLAEDAERSVVTELLPLATLLTPNLEETSILSGIRVVDVHTMRTAAVDLVDRGVAAVLVKGGHLAGDAVDLFWDGTTERLWSRPRIDTRHTHGTGCTLSAAIAAGLAHGRDLITSIDAATRFIRRAIADAPGLGHGRGPVNHFAPVD